MKVIIPSSAGLQWKGENMQLLKKWVFGTQDRVDFETLRLRTAVYLIPDPTGIPMSPNKDPTLRPRLIQLKGHPRILIILFEDGTDTPHLNG